MAAELEADLAGIETATLGHFLSEGFMAPSIQALQPGAQLLGPAMTVRVPGNDGAALVAAVSRAEVGQVIVVDRCGEIRHACWGAVLTHAAMARGVAGVVIDGLITDRPEILRLGFPVWCRGRSPLTTRLRGMGGEVNGLISCGGVTVAAGDIILADDNGVVVLDPATAAQHAATARQMQEDELRILRRLQAGETLAEITGQKMPVTARRGRGQACHTG